MYYNYIYNDPEEFAHRVQAAKRLRKGAAAPILHSPDSQRKNRLEIGTSPGARKAIIPKPLLTELLRLRSSLVTHAD